MKSDRKGGAGPVKIESINPYVEFELNKIHASIVGYHRQLQNLREKIAGELLSFQNNPFATEERLVKFGNLYESEVRQTFEKISIEIAGLKTKLAGLNAEGLASYKESTLAGLKNLDKYMKDYSAYMENELERLEVLLTFQEEDKATFVRNIDSQTQKEDEKNNLAIANFISFAQPHAEILRLVNDKFILDLEGLEAQKKINAPSKDQKQPSAGANARSSQSTISHLDATVKSLESAVAAGTTKLKGNELAALNNLKRLLIDLQSSLHSSSVLTAELQAKKLKSGDLKLSGRIGDLKALSSFKKRSPRGVSVDNTAAAGAAVTASDDYTTALTRIERLLNARQQSVAQSVSQASKNSKAREHAERDQKFYTDFVVALATAKQSQPTEQAKLQVVINTLAASAGNAAQLPQRTTDLNAILVTVARQYVNHAKIFALFDVAIREKAQKGRSSTMGISIDLKSLHAHSNSASSSSSNSSSRSASPAEGDLNEADLEEMLKTRDFARRQKIERGAAPPKISKETAAAPAATAAGKADLSSSDSDAAPPKLSKETAAAPAANTASAAAGKTDLSSSDSDDIEPPSPPPEDDDREPASPHP